MRVNVAYESKFGNGKQCASRMAEMIQERGAEVQVFSVREARPGSIPAGDHYVFSTPTHANRPSGRMKRFLRKLDPMPGTGFALITTHASPSTKALEGMEAILEEKGMRRVCEGLKLRVLAVKGPLEGDYEIHLTEFLDRALRTIE